VAVTGVVEPIPGVAAPSTAADGGAGDGIVVGTPRRWLRVEGAVLVAGSLVAYSTTDQAWWLAPLTLLLPDLTMIGYLGGTRLGSYLYNLGHSTPLPAGLSPSAGGKASRCYSRSAWSGSPTSASIA
jgi:hypothetical protein